MLQFEDAFNGTFLKTVGMGPQSHYWGAQSLLNRRPQQSPKRSKLLGMNFDHRVPGRSTTLTLEHSNIGGAVLV